MGSSLSKAFSTPKLASKAPSQSKSTVHLPKTDTASFSFRPFKRRSKTQHNPLFSASLVGLNAHPVTPSSKGMSVHSLQSQDSSAPQFVQYNGRQYTTGSNSFYLLPSDIKEMDRLDQEHYLIKTVLHRNYLVSLQDFASHGMFNRALDVGHGTGIWMCEMAAEFPKCEFIGVDIANLHPQAIVPSNCKFMKCNVLDGLPFEDESFDYIHQRLLVTGVPVHAYDALIKNYMRVLRPGGCIEICETDYHFLRTGPLGDQMNRWLSLLSRSSGIHLSFIRNMQDMLKDANFTKVGRETISFPLGTWSEKLSHKDSDSEAGDGHQAYLPPSQDSTCISVGTMAMTNAVDMLKALSGLIQERLDVDEVDISRVIRHWPEECEEYQTYLNLKVYYGCKQRRPVHAIVE